MQRLLDNSGSVVVRCECSACGVRFGSAFAFYMHRTGKGPSCLTLLEMIECGMIQESRGEWVVRHLLPDEVSTVQTPALQVGQISY
jgi:hypothetical protein